MANKFFFNAKRTQHNYVSAKGCGGRSYYLEGTNIYVRLITNGHDVELVKVLPSATPTEASSAAMEACNIYIISIYLFRRCFMKTAKLFQNGQSQAVRLPREFRFEDDHVYVKKSGNVVMLIPAKGSWDMLVKSLDKFSPDFMSERKQPKTQKRESF